MWLLREDVALALERAQVAGKMPSAEAQAAYVAQMEASQALGTPRNMKVAGNTAEIRVEGVLTPKPDLFARWFGGGNTTYEEINSALAMAAADPAVKKVVFHIDSPGGAVDGLFDTLAAIEVFDKPKSVRAAYACSAAYAIAAVAGKIEATNPAVVVGSIGVAVTYLHFEELIDITSTMAPKKRPDPSTEEGKAVIREHLDAIHDLFVDAIARGRSNAGAAITAKEVNAQFGQGAVLLANEAKRRGMIDRVAPKAVRAVNVETDSTDQTDATADDGGAQTERNAMNAEELKAKHPETYNAVLELGMTQGAKKERDRVNAHLIRGDASGDMKTALAAIESGDEMNETYKAKYDAAAMKRNAISAADADEQTVAGAVGNAAPKAPEKDEGDLIADAMDQISGKAVK